MNLHPQHLWEAFQAARAQPTQPDEGPSGLDMARVLFLSLLFFLLALFILVVDLTPGKRVQLDVGDVSPVDIRAPRSIRYESEVLTRAAREKAAQAIPEVYDPPQPQIARQQINRLKAIIDFINTVRANPYASVEEKTREIQAITDLALPPDMARMIVTMPENRWALVANESLETLRLAMSREIRENELAVVRSNVPLLVDQTRLSEPEALLVTRIVQALLRANTFPNPQKTERQRQKAREAVEPVVVQYEAGEIVVRSGEVVTEAQVEALDKLGLRQKRITWSQIASWALLLLLFWITVLLYTYRHYPTFWKDVWEPVVFYVFISGGLLLAKALVPGQQVLAFTYPLGALAITVSTVQNRGLSWITIIYMALILGRLGDNSLLLTAHAGLGAFFMVLISDRAERLATFLWGAVALALVQIVVLLVFALGNGVLDVNNLLGQAVASIINSVLSASLALANFYLLGFLLGTTTILQLMDLARPNHPLLQQLVTKAPGTYYHSLIVSNLAEHAAAAIGADAFLTRVGTYYHDIGKIKRPHYFTENQHGGVNPHDRLDPRTSAQIIISHVVDGLELARQYHLPRRIRDFIAEHHGTTLVSYFYQKAVEAAGGDPSKVNEEDFRYPGPKPRSKETAILMLADAIEAIARAQQPTTREEIEEIVHSLIMRRLKEGQLDDAPITMRDLKKVAQVFVEMLVGVYHTRVSYPEQVRGLEGVRSND
ncbi:MAG: HDIG domain-containing protein [Chloroflexi bacterium]|nr:HDIG domain-containing protein [Chloroflexota bacterium]